MKEFKTVSDLCNCWGLVPEVVALDVLGRILDYLVLGGKEQDEYVQKELKLVSQFIGEV